MSFEPKQEDTEVSPIIEAKLLLSNGDVAEAFAVLKKGAEDGDVMACYDCGFMMIQGIGCEKDQYEGLEVIETGRKLEKESSDNSWKLDGTATDLLQPQSMDFNSLFLLIITTCFGHKKSLFPLSKRSVNC